MMILRWNFVGVLLIVVIANTHAKNDIRQGSIYTNSSCPVLTECPFNPNACQDDDDCNPDSVCCKSPCGQVCSKQLNTGCRTLRTAASRRAKSLGVETKQVRMPRCSLSGAFEPIQCSNEIVSSCWCVDDQGFEQPGTRAPAAALVNCTAPKACAAHTCRMFCPHGFSLAKDGCPLCRCRDPCEDIMCPDSLACHLEELACADPPCPPIPTCKRGRSLDNICPVGDPLRISDTVRPFLCGNDPTKPTCPPMYQCLVQKGNDYGVCCPASLQIKKTGTCPANVEEDCGILCTHDLECPSVQKCCNTERCGSSCTHPTNITECIHQRALSEVLAVSERAGRGYVPQCANDGQFEPKQCSRNQLVCWCVDRIGRKLRGSMGPKNSVNCSITDARSANLARSITINGHSCARRDDCAAVCEYGYALDAAGCPSCKCDDPCAGYACAADEECVSVRESSCADFLCPTIPVCRPKQTYSNPCSDGTPLTDDLTGSPVECTLRADDAGQCPAKHVCTAVPGATQSVCCPIVKEELPMKDLQMDQEAENSENIRPQTMCEYLHSFADSMEGTREGMSIALPSPTCDPQGNFLAQQCHNATCWCVDHFGTEIPRTRGTLGGSSAARNCTALWADVECLDLTCRLGCDYGYVLDGESGCPSCECRDPCAGVRCARVTEQCQLVEVSCVEQYCPPVPACLPKKIGQCPYLIPTASTSCDFECNSDLSCNGSTKCCSNGCGTQCIEPLLMTACQHQRAVAQHQSHEAGIAPTHYYIPKCTASGNFTALQCNGAIGQCYCVDAQGHEISQTRAPSAQPPSCDGMIPAAAAAQRSKCPMVPTRCPVKCEHGNKFDMNGCRTCDCTDPCAQVTCREQGETCRLVQVECVGGPCPSVPMCLPRRERPCPGGGAPLRMGDEQVICGPDYDTCPSSHKCQLSPLGEYAVCCPKPRDVCFEAIDKGKCIDEDLSRNLTRFNFNARTNKCEHFTFTGCLGNHNNFHSEEMCNTVCPVLSQCERLREKNQRAAERYNKPTFAPRCDDAGGNWAPVQCLEHVGVCWCVTPQGEPLKGTLTRGAQPQCNFRQARNRARDRSDVLSDADLVLEELMMQLGSLEEDEDDFTANKDGGPMTLDQAATGDNSGQRPVIWELPLRSRCESLDSQCDHEGRFLPAQCDEQDVCWCVDEAGNQLANTAGFKKGTRLCLPTPVESVEVTLGFRGEYDDVSALPVLNQVGKVIRSMKGELTSDGLVIEPSADVLYIKLSLIGANKVNVAYRLEQMVMQQRLPGLTADITRSRFTHRLATNDLSSAERVVALDHREIVSQSPVSLVAQYHTALIVIAASSAFIICVLTLLVILYRRKMANLNIQTDKVIEDNQRFLSLNRPIYIELPNEKTNPARPDLKSSF